VVGDGGCVEAGENRKVRIYLGGMNLPILFEFIDQSSSSWNRSAPPSGVREPEQ